MARGDGSGRSAGADPDDLSPPADSMRARTGETRGKMWFLITANRWVVCGLVLAGTFVLLVALGQFGPRSTQHLMTTEASGSVFSSMIIAIVTSVTLVLTVAQLVLSQEIAPLGEQRERMQSEVGFREEVEERLDADVSPPEPAGFLQSLVDLSDDRARAIADAVDEDAADEEGDAADEISRFVDGLTDHGETVRTDLADAEFGSFEVLLPVLNYNYSWKIFAARRLRHKHADSLSEEAHEAFDELIDALRLFGPAREYFKALYFQWEIINVSRAMLYGSMPALALTGYMLFLVDPGLLTEAVFGIETAFLFVSAVFVVTLVPFAVLLAYILRVLTVVKRTLSIGPFILRETERSDAVRRDE